MDIQCSGRVMVVVENPPSLGKDGELQENVGIGVKHWESAAEGGSSGAESGEVDMGTRGGLIWGPSFFAATAGGAGGAVEEVGPASHADPLTGGRASRGPRAVRVFSSTYMSLRCDRDNSSGFRDKWLIVECKCVYCASRPL